MHTVLHMPTVDGSALQRVGSDGAVPIYWYWSQWSVSSWIIYFRIPFNMFWIEVASYDSRLAELYWFITELSITMAIDYRPFSSIRVIVWLVLFSFLLWRLLHVSWGISDPRYFCGEIYLEILHPFVQSSLSNLKIAYNWNL